MDNKSYFDQLGLLDGFESEPLSPGDEAAALELRAELAAQRREEQAIMLGANALGFTAADGTRTADDVALRAVASGHTSGTYVPGALSTRE